MSSITDEQDAPNYTKIVVKGVGISLVASIFGAIFGYLFRIILARGLSIEGYGTFYAIAGLFSILGFVQNLGLKSALIKEIPVYSSKKDFGTLKYLLFTSFGIWFGLSVIISIFTMFFSSAIATYYLKDVSLAPFIVAYSILFLLYPLESLLRSCFFGFQKVEYVSIIDLVKSVLISIITYILFQSTENEILAPIIAYIITYIITMIFIGLPLLKKIFPTILSVSQQKDKKPLFSLFKFGIQVSVTNVIELVFVYTDVFLITVLSSLTEVGYYNVGMPTSRILWRFIAPLGQIFLPLTSLLWSQGKTKKLQQGIQESYHYSLILMLPSAFSLMFYAKLIIVTLFGWAYLPAVPVLQVLAFSSIFCYLSKISTTTLMGIGKPELVTKITLVSSVINLIANVILIPVMGSVGAAIGTLLSFIVLTVASQRKLNQELNTKIIDNKTPRILFSGFLFVLITMLLQNVVMPANILGAILYTVIAGVSYLGTLFLFKCLVMNDIIRIYKAVVR